MGTFENKHPGLMRESLSPKTVSQLVEAEDAHCRAIPLSTNLGDMLAKGASFGNFRYFAAHYAVYSRHLAKHGEYSFLDKTTCEHDDYDAHSIERHIHFSSP
jgi:hypothetical protein